MYERESSVLWQSFLALLVFMYIHVFNLSGEVLSYGRVS